MLQDKKIKTPMKAIRAKCLDCCCGSYSEVRHCLVKNCALYPYRMGKRPTTDTLPPPDESSEETHE